LKKGNSKKKNNTVFILFSLVLGLLMGWLARDLEGMRIVGTIIGNMGLWVFVSALLAVYTPESVRAALHVFVYFAGVIAAYFAHHIWLGGGVSTRTLIYWLIFAAIGALIGFIDWHTFSKEWLGALCTAVPISLLIAEAYPIHKGFSIPLAFDLVCAVVLYIIMAPGKLQKLMALPIIIIFTFALVYFDVLSGIFGGFI